MSTCSGPPRQWWKQDTSSGLPKMKKATNAEGKHSGKSSGSRNSGSLKQMCLDVGQKGFGRVSCAICGMTYLPGDPSDEKLHKQHHNATSATFRFQGWAQERCVSREADGRVVHVQSTDPASHIAKLSQLCSVVEETTGWQQGWLTHPATPLPPPPPPSTDTAMHSTTQPQAQAGSAAQGTAQGQCFFLHVSPSKELLGLLVIDMGSTARWMSPDQHTALAGCHEGRPRGESTGGVQGCDGRQQQGVEQQGVLTNGINRAAAQCEAVDDDDGGGGGVSIGRKRCRQLDDVWDNPCSPNQHHTSSVVQVSAVQAHPQQAHPQQGPHAAGPRAAGPRAAGPRAAGPRAAGPRAAQGVGSMTSRAGVNTAGESTGGMQGVQARQQATGAQPGIATGAVAVCQDVLFGVRAVWVAPNARQLNIPTRLVNIARCHTVPGYVVPVDRIAWSLTGLTDSHTYDTACGLQTKDAKCTPGLFVYDV